MLRKKRNIGFIALNTDANDSIYFFFSYFNSKYFFHKLSKNSTVGRLALTGESFLMGYTVENQVLIAFNDEQPHIVYYIIIGNRFSLDLSYIKSSLYLIISLINLNFLMRSQRMLVNRFRADLDSF